MEKRNKVRRHIECFNPDVEVYNQIHQDFFCPNIDFNAGIGYEQFGDFILNDVQEFMEDGNGVTYIVWNEFTGETASDAKREIVAYYTLSATAIPYEDRIRLDKEEAIEKGTEYDVEVCGISALKIDMFAVDEKYQDLFYEFEGEDLPISAWVMRNIIDYAKRLSNSVLGFKAIFLHALPNAEGFYIANGFHLIKENMQPLHGIDSEFKAMYLALKPIHMNYE